MRIFLDDCRIPPDGFVLVKTSCDAIKLITEFWNEIEEISLDHDLGDESLYGNGYQVVCEMEAFVFRTRPKHLPYIHVHSANPVGRKRMEYGIENIRRIIHLHHK